MANEVTVPLLPCGSIDETRDFYEMLGFAVTYRQTRPNPYLCVRREDLQLHFFGLPDFDPEQSYGSCLVFVPDTGELFANFAEAMRATHGKLLISGIPRITRPRKRKNTGDVSGFSVIDPGGNWIRIFETSTSEPLEEPASKLAKTLQNAVVLGESKGDHRQAAKILDAALSKKDDSASAVDRVEAMVYRAELAVTMRDGQRADALLAAVRDTELAEHERDQLRDALANAGELELILRADR